MQVSGKNVMHSGNAFSHISERPNILFSDIRRGSADNVIPELLRREEINVYSDPDGASRLMTDCPTGSWHMAVIRDSGLEEPAFGLIEKIRHISDIPVLSVSDSCSEIYRIMALSKGADACMDAGTDFCRYEFKARVVSMLRRQLGLYAGCTEKKGAAAIIGDIMANGELVVDRRRREVFTGGERIRVTAIEYGILEYLMENCGDVCTIEDIYRRVWNGTPFDVRKTVVEHIRRIRSKIEPDPHRPSYITSVFGRGYKMEMLA